MGIAKGHRWPWTHEAGVAEPQERLFARLFRRLFFWYTSILAVLALLLGLSIGTTVPWLLYVSTEHDLSGRLTQLAQDWQRDPAGSCPIVTPGQGYMLACYDAQGKLVHSTGTNSDIEKHVLTNTTRD